MDANIKLTTKLLSKGVRRTSPKLNNSLDKQLGSTIPDLLFQLKVLDLMSPAGNTRGLNKFGNDLSKLAKTLNVLRKFPSNHEELTEFMSTVTDITSVDSSFSLEISAMREALPHFAGAIDTASLLYIFSSELLDVNNPLLQSYAEEIEEMLGSVATSEDNTNKIEKNKNVREQFIRFIGSTLVNTRQIEPIKIERGDFSTTVGGSQALSHKLGDTVKNHPEKTTNAFLNRISVKKDKRGVQYLVSNSKGILQPELAEIYADFQRLDPQLQEDLLVYTIAKEGMLFASSNITMIMRPEMYGATKDRKIGYDTERSNLLFNLLKSDIDQKTGRSPRLDNTKESFMLQYALSNIGQIASTGSKKITQALVKEDGSAFGVRRTTLPSTGETIFYDLKLDKKELDKAPLLMSNPNYGQVYIRIHEDIATDDSKGFAYYQVVAKGSSTASLYSVQKEELSAEYKLDKHFKKNALARSVEDPAGTMSIDLFKEIKGLKQGDKMILRKHHDVLRLSAVEVTVENVKKVSVKDKATGVKRSVFRVTFAKKRKRVSSFIQTANQRYAEHVVDENRCN